MKKLILLFTLFLSTGSFAYDHKPTTRLIKKELRTENRLVYAKRTDIALDAVVRLGIWKLRQEGYNTRANRFENEWFSKHRGTVTRIESEVLGLTNEIGDYNPMSKWLSDFYAELEAVLGKTVCEFLHLDDINTLNFTIPVVFHMEEVLGPVSMDLNEYSLHFNPFWGVVAYWSVWAGCEIVTASAGWSLACTPAGNVAEMMTKKYIAPPFADDGFRIFWEEQ